MRDRAVASGLSDSPVPPLDLASLEFLHRAVEAYDEDIVRLEEEQQPIHPSTLFDDVLDEQVVSRFGECRDAAMEALEERLPRARPFELPEVDRLARQYTARIQMVDRVVPEGPPGSCSHGSCKRRFAATGGAVRKDDPDGHR